MRVDHSSYAARPAPIGSIVLVRLFEHHLEIRDLTTQALIRSHPRAARPGSVLLPHDERPFNPTRETRRILTQAQHIGPSAERLCQRLFEREGRVGQRQLWGIVQLVKRYPRRLIDQVCAMALHEGVQNYLQIKALTERLFNDALAGFDEPIQGELALIQHDPLIRSGDDYADLFTLGAQTSANLPTPHGGNTMSMTMHEIERALRALRLSSIRATLETRVLQAQANQEPFLETFSMILQDELDRRRSRLMERRYQLSGLDERATLTDFDWRFNPKIPRQACFELDTLKFITEGQNALIIGKPGTGKSRVAKAIAYQATLHGYRVRVLEADSVFAQYALGSPADQQRLLAPWVEADLVVLDDLFLARRISESAAEVLQSLVHQRYKSRRSIVVTSNRVVQDWGKYLGDNTASTTILDLLMHRSHLLEFEGRSYRLKEATKQFAQPIQSSVTA